MDVAVTPRLRERRVAIPLHLCAVTASNNIDPSSTQRPPPPVIRPFANTMEGLLAPRLALAVGCGSLDYRTFYDEDGDDSHRNKVEAQLAASRYSSSARVHPLAFDLSFFNVLRPKWTWSDTGVDPTPAARVCRDPDATWLLEHQTINLIRPLHSTTCWDPALLLLRGRIGEETHSAMCGQDLFTIVRGEDWGLVFSPPQLHETFGPGFKFSDVVVPWSLDGQAVIVLSPEPDQHIPPALASSGFDTKAFAPFNVTLLRLQQQPDGLAPPLLCLSVLPPDTPFTAHFDFETTASFDNTTEDDDGATQKSTARQRCLFTAAVVVEDMRSHLRGLRRTCALPVQSVEIRDFYNDGSSVVKCLITSPHFVNPTRVVALFDSSLLVMSDCVAMVDPFTLHVTPQYGINCNFCSVVEVPRGIGLGVEQDAFNDADGSHSILIGASRGRDEVMLFQRTGKRGMELSSMSGLKRVFVGVGVQDLALIGMPLV